MVEGELMPYTSSSMVPKAFGDGADARLAGKPLSANPYTANVGRVDASLEAAWVRGWEDVAQFWGRNEHRRPVRELPPVSVREGSR